MEHVERLCKKASQKVSALARISSLMRFEQRKRIVNSFITSHFSFCPLVWMFHSRRLNNRINHIHKRALRIIYPDYNSAFKELLRKDSSLTIHQRNLKLLVTEIFKVKIGCVPDIMKEIFEIENQNTTSAMTFKLNGVTFDWFIMVLKQLLLLDQKYRTLCLIAAKMQPHKKVLK